MRFVWRRDATRHLPQQIDNTLGEKLKLHARGQIRFEGNPESLAAFKPGVTCKRISRRRPPLRRGLLPRFSKESGFLDLNFQRVRLRCKTSQYLLRFWA
jgi:hypothetical protein